MKANTYYYLGTACLASLLVTHFATAIFSILDGQGGMNNADNTDVTLVFGTGAWYIVAMSVPAVLMAGFLTFGSLEHESYRSGTADRAMFSYPRYTWDVYTYVTLFFVYWGVTTSIQIAYMASYGFGHLPSFAAGTSGHPATDKFLFISHFATAANAVLLMAGLDALYAYGMKIYKLRSINDMGVKVSQ